MKKIILLLLCLQYISSHVIAGPSKKDLLVESLTFTENKGQVANFEGVPQPEVLFYGQSGGAQVFITSGKIYYQFSRSTGNDVSPNGDKPGDLQLHRFHIELVNANTHSVFQEEEASPGLDNFYLPQCPQGITGVRSFRRIIFREVYPKIDWVIYSSGNRMKYDFILHPGADPQQIKIRVKDADRYFIDEKGALVMQTRLGMVQEEAPVSFKNGRKIESRFTQCADGTIGFQVASPGNETIIIDPSVKWSTYYASPGTFGWGTCADAAGNVYLCGPTNSSPILATSGSFQTVFAGNIDAYLVKFDSSGARLWATYYGGANTEFSAACTTDNSGNVYMSGRTNSPTVIASGGFQNTIGGADDAFLVKFNSAGLRLWGTYYGGSQAETAEAVNSVRTDTAGNVYLAGVAMSSSGIASVNAFDVTYGGGSTGDLFLAKFAPTGGRLWATYCGGASSELGGSVSIDPSSNVYLSGSTSSVSDIASSSGFQTTFSGGTADALLVKYDLAGNRIWGTYYGGPGNEEIGYCGTDSTGNVYLTGTTASTSGIASGGFQNTFGGGQNDLFAVKFNASGNRLWGTYYGTATSSTPATANVDKNTASVVTPDGSIYLTGFTNSPDSFASNGFQSAYGGGTHDCFLIKFNTSGNRIWASYFGGSLLDQGYGCAIDNQGNVLLTGHTNSSSGIATPNGFQNSVSTPGPIVFLAKIDHFMAVIDTLPDTLCASSPITVPYTATNNFQAGNVFTLEMSDVNGSFASPVSIGSTTAITSGTINGTIPATTATGTQYKFRITSSAPPMSLDYTNAKLVVIKGVPSLTLFGTDSLCAQSGETWYVDSIPLGETYAWILPSNWSGSSDSTSINILTSTEGTYTLKAVAGNGCFLSDTATIQVIVLPLPQPVITQNGITLSTSPGYMAYQWLLNDVVIPGAVFSAINPLLYADYRVVVTDSFGCSDTSAILTLAPPAGIKAPSDVVDVEVYPNPVIHRLYLNSPKVVLVELTGLDGKRLWYGKYTDKGIDCHALDNGIYFLKLYDQKSNLLQVKKVIKTSP